MTNDDRNSIIQSPKTVLAPQPKASTFSPSQHFKNKSIRNVENAFLNNQNLQTIEPKVMVPFDEQYSQHAKSLNPFESSGTNANQTFHSSPPRKIEVFRKQKYYDSQNIEEILLNDFEIDYKRYDVDVDHTTGKRALLPLKLFDNLDYENHTPQEWIKLGTVYKSESAICRIPARALKLRICP